MQETYFLAFASWGCYNYTHPWLIEGELLIPKNCLNLGVPALPIGNVS